MAKIIVFILKKIPFKINRLLGILLGLIFTIGSKNKNVVRQNIQLCFPNLDKTQQQKLVKQNLIELGKSIVETPLIWNQNITIESKIITSISGLELLNNNNKMILLIPHFGSFEILGKVVASIRSAVFLYKKSEKKFLDKIIINNREHKNFMLASTDIKGIAKVSKALDDNIIVGILPDQYPQGKGFVFTDFFNIKVKTTTLLVKLMRKHHTRVILAYAKRNNKGFDIVFKKVYIGAETIEDSVLKMNTGIEALAQEYPAQYFWNYKRFKGSYDYQ